MSASGTWDDTGGPDRCTVARCDGCGACLAIACTAAACSPAEVGRNTFSGRNAASYEARGCRLLVAILPSMLGCLADANGIAPRARSVRGRSAHALARCVRRLCWYAGAIREPAAYCYQSRFQRVLRSGARYTVARARGSGRGLLRGTAAHVSVHHRSALWKHARRLARNGAANRSGLFATGISERDPLGTGRCGEARSGHGGAGA